MKFIDDFFLLNDKGKYKPIEGLRALAVIMVFNVHFCAQYYQRHYFLPENSVWEFLAEVLHAGHLGVDVFFVISGFLIYRNLFEKKPQVMPFLKKRALRLLPSHVFVLLILTYPAFNLFRFVRNTFYISHSYNFVAWSLAWEWRFYILILLVGIVSRFKVKRAFLLLAAYTAVSFFLQAGLKVSVPDTFRFSGFFLGCAVAAVRGKYKFEHSPAALGWTALAAVLALFGSSAVWAAYSSAIYPSLALRSCYYLGVGGIASALLYAVLGGDSFMARAFSLKPLRIIGEMSYSFYLIHAAIGIPYAVRLTGEGTSPAGIVGAYAVAFALTFFISAFVYYYTERDYFLKRKLPAVALPLAVPAAAAVLPKADAA